MQISRILTNGAARDDALKRRNASVREVLGMKPPASPETDKPQEPKADERPE
jgi:hypothetical protein